MLPPLEFLNCGEHLPNLIRLGLPLVVLDVDPRVARPWCLKDRVARSALTWFAEMLDADLHQIRKTNVARLAAYGFKNLLRSRHANYGTTIGTTENQKRSSELWIDSPMRRSAKLKL